MDEFFSASGLVDIIERCWQSRQAWEYERIVQWDAVTCHGHPVKLRVSIKRDAYDPQSWARTYRWDGTQWQLVFERSIGECHCCGPVAYISRDVKPDAFHEDAKELLTVTMNIVG